MHIDDITDLIQRRTYATLPNDHFKQIYAQFGRRPSHVNFILDRDLDPDTLTKLRVRYMRMFEDLKEEVTISVVDRIRPTQFDMLIWTKEGGFTNSE